LPSINGNNVLKYNYNKGSECMSEERLEEAIQEVIKANHYSKDQEEQFRKFMKDLVKEYNSPHNKQEEKLARMIEDMGQEINDIPEEVNNSGTRIM